MRPGRKPQPAALKMLHGNPGRRRLNREPAPQCGRMKAPRELAAVPGALRYWDHHLATAPQGILKPIDAPLLVKLCVELAIGDRALRELRRHGYVITTSTGTIIQSPWVGILHRSTEIARKLSSELGLVVTARARLDAPDDLDVATAGDPNELEAYLAQHPDRALN
jgi:P27 family predicted phage terminase small subunit